MHDGKDDSQPVAEFYDIDEALDYIRAEISNNAPNNAMSIVKIA
jgi:hypothetical protein